MIRLVVGGVALAATGYGVAKMLDGTSCSGSSLNTENEDSSDFALNKALDDLIVKDDDLVEENDEDYPTKPFLVSLGDDVHEEQEDDNLVKYDLAKIVLYNTTFIDLTTALKEIDNLPEEIEIATYLKLVQTIYPFQNISDDLNKDFNKQTLILHKTKRYLDSKLDALDAIIINESDFEKYSDGDKALVQKCIKIFKLIDHAVFSKITNDEESVSREVKRAFAKAEQLID